MYRIGWLEFEMSSKEVLLLHKLHALYMHAITTSVSIGHLVYMVAL
jgi:hypothetical protein